MVLAPSPIIIEDYLPLAERVARRFHRGPTPIRDSDAFSLASLELVRVRDEYIPACGEFEPFAARAMRNALIDDLRRRGRKKRSDGVRVRSAPPEGWDAVPSRPDRPTVPPGLLDSLLSDHEDDSPRDRQDKMLIARLSAGDSASRLADELGVSRVTIYTRINRMTALLRVRHAGTIRRYEDLLDGSA